MVNQINVTPFLFLELPLEYYSPFIKVTFPEVQSYKFSFLNAVEFMNMTHHL